MSASLHPAASAHSSHKPSRRDRPSVIVLWFLLIALSLAFMVTYSLSIHNLVENDLISLSSGPRLASDLAFMTALALPPFMAIVFFAYWTQRFVRTPRLLRGEGFLGALRVSFLGISILFLESALIMQSYHADLQNFSDVLDTDVYPDDINHVEAALEAAFGLGYTLAGLAAVIFAILLDASAAATLFCSGLDTGTGAPLYFHSEVPPGSAGPGTGDVYKARLASEAAAAYAARGLLPHGPASHHGSGMDPRFSSGEVVERDGDGTGIAPDGVSRVAQQSSPRGSRHSVTMTTTSGSGGEHGALLNGGRGGRHSRGPSGSAGAESTAGGRSTPPSDTRAGFGLAPTSRAARSLSWRPSPPRADAEVTGTLGLTMEWTDFRRVAQACTKALDELEVALDAMCAMRAQFFLRYEILSAVDRRIGGQGLVQYACVPNQPDRVAIKFYLDSAAFQRERELYTQSQLKEMMPATLAIEDNADGAAATPYGYTFPPFVIIEHGQSLDEWARRNNADFITIFQSLSHAVRALVKLHGFGYAHRDIKPGNILRRPNQHDWTLIDFGCTAQIGSIAPLSYSLRYAPPEVIHALEAGQRTVKADPAVDIWAVGVIAYELLTGERAFHQGGLDPATAEAAALDAISGRSPLPWERKDAGAQLDKLRGLKRTVLRCLERDPARRPSAHALLKSWDHTFDNMQSQGTLFTKTASATADAAAPAPVPVTAPLTAAAAAAAASEPPA